MSWVTDILLLFSLGEVYDDDGEEIEEVTPLININAWLQEHGWRTLDDLCQCVNTGKSMQSRVYGGAFNFLKIDDFIKIVKTQEWREPHNVQLLIKDEEDEKFTLYEIVSI
ncbi:MAG TPA: hypothetical protein V6D28_19030 [Leptolyngbyaceae cyanobacterium]